MKFKTQLLWLLMIFGLLFPVKAMTQESYLFVGTTFPLILEQGDDNKPQGVAVDLLKEISKITGDRYAIKIVPWPRAMALIKKGHASALIGPYKNAERETFMDFSTSHFYEDRMVFLKRQDNPAKWRGNFNEIQKKKILTIQKWAYGENFNSHRSYLHISETAESKNAIKMLVGGRVDLLAFNERNAKAEIKSRSLEGLLEICLPAYAENRGYFGFSKARSESGLIKRFNDAMNQLLASGEIKRINALYHLPFDNK